MLMWEISLELLSLIDITESTSCQASQECCHICQSLCLHYTPTYKTEIDAIESDIPTSYIIISSLCMHHTPIYKTESYTIESDIPTSDIIISLLCLHYTPIYKTESYIIESDIPTSDIIISLLCLHSNSNLQDRERCHWSGYDHISNHELIIEFSSRTHLQDRERYHWISHYHTRHHHLRRIAITQTWHIRISVNKECPDDPR